MNPLLKGVRILDLTRLLPGPFCTLYLAQLGATVIKIEEPNGGDYARTLSPEMFELGNRSKQSVTIDLKKPEGIAALKTLARDADVLIESFRPGVMDKLGVGYETLKAINPNLVFAALTGYGHTGPYRDRAGHDMNYCGYAGTLDQIGTAGGSPALPGFQIADLAGGSLTCALAVVAAVFGARSSGEGCFVDAAMLDGTLALQIVTLGTLRALGTVPPRGNDMLTGGLPNYSVYECADGKHVAMAALEFKFWVNFCNAVGKPEWAKKTPMPGAAGAPLRAELVALFKTRPRDEWEALLANADACVSGILTPAESLANEQVTARGLIDTTSGKPACGFPVRFVGAETNAGLPAPKLGADNGRVHRQTGV
jgi:crotonobetainyl-CoA:carnitine CoA-transferase CaiB-like acyl-CoA transferase